MIKKKKLEESRDELERRDYLQRKVSDPSFSLLLRVAVVVTETASVTASVTSIPRRMRSRRCHVLLSRRRSRMIDVLMLLRRSWLERMRSVRLHLVRRRLGLRETQMMP